MQSLSLSAFVTAPFRAPRAGFAVGRARARMCATHPAARPAEVAAAAARLAAQAAKTAPQKPAVRVVCCDMVRFSSFADGVPGVAG